MNIELIPAAPAEYLVADLFCCDGAVTVGLRRAFEAAGLRVRIVGVDIADHSANYPGDEFHQGDAITFAQRYGRSFHYWHGSPPCQGSAAPTLGTNKARNLLTGRAHPHLIAPARQALRESGRPFTIENVPPAVKREGLRPDLRLCGEMFGLGVLQHRVFEVEGFNIPQPAHRRHRGYVRGWRHGVYRDGPYVAAYGEGGGKATVAEMQAAKGIDWTGDHLALREAIPPAYAQLVGTALIEHLTGRHHATPGPRLAALVG